MQLYTKKIIIIINYNSNYYYIIIINKLSSTFDYNWSANLASSVFKIQNDFIIRFIEQNDIFADSINLKVCL